MAKRKFSAAQLAAQRRFAAAARAGTLRKGGKLRATRKARKSNPVAKSPSRARRAARNLRQRVNIKRMATRAGAGALARYAPTVAGSFGPGLALTAVGLATNDLQVEAMGEVALGSALAGSLGGSAGYAPPASSGLI